MKKPTHMLFNLGFLSVLAVGIGIDLPTRLILSPLFFFGGVINDVLDFRVFSGKPHRNFWTHSFVSPIVLMLFLVPFLLVLSVNTQLAVFSGAFMVFSYYAHLFLDMLNPTGVFLNRKQKLAGKIRYDNFIANLGFLILGFILFLISTMIAGN